MTTVTEQPRARKAERAAMASLGAVAGPLAGARAPQRVSTPPSSGLAAALPWPSTASPRPRLGFFSRAGEKVHPTHPNPNAFFPFLILSCSFRVYPNGKTRVRVRVRSCRFDFFAFVSFFFIHPNGKLGLGLGFDPSFFLLPLFSLSDLRLGFSESDPPFFPCSDLIWEIRVRS